MDSSTYLEIHAITYPHIYVYCIQTFIIKAEPVHKSHILTWTHIIITKASWNFRHICIFREYQRDVQHTAERGKQSCFNQQSSLICIIYMYTISYIRMTVNYESESLQKDKVMVNITRLLQFIPQDSKDDTIQLVLLGLWIICIISAFQIRHSVCLEYCDKQRA